MGDFKLVSNYKPSGDQPNAIKELVDGVIVLYDGNKDYTISVDVEGVWNIVSGDHMA